MGEIVLAEELPSLEEIAGLPRMCQGKIILGGGTATLLEGNSTDGENATLKGTDGTAGKVSG
jgi:hypothetical protein